MNYHMGLICDLRLNLFPHVQQEDDFSPVWILIGAANEDARLNLISLASQVRRPCVPANGTNM